MLCGKQALFFWAETLLYLQTAMLLDLSNLFFILLCTEQHDKEGKANFDYIFIKSCFFFSFELYPWS
jgi:hypothetical protein